MLKYIASGNPNRQRYGPRIMLYFEIVASHRLKGSKNYGGSKQLDFIFLY